MILGRPCSTETRQKIAKSLTGKKHPDEVKLKISKAGKGRVFSELHKQRIGDKQRLLKN